MTSKTGTQTVTIKILPNISRSKGNQTMKLDKLIEYNVRNILLQKSYIKWDTETSFHTSFVFWKSFVKCKSKCVAPYF